MPVSNFPDCPRCGSDHVVVDFKVFMCDECGYAETVYVVWPTYDEDRWGDNSINDVADDDDDGDDGDDL